jgi:hypothetical protein
LPAEPSQAFSHHVYNTIFERIAVAALRSHHLPLAHSAVRMGLSRPPSQVGKEKLQLLVTEVDILTRQGRTDVAMEKARFLSEHATDLLAQISLSATPPEEMHQALVSFSRAHGRLAEILFLRGDLNGSAREFEQSLFGYDQILEPHGSSNRLFAHRSLKNLFDTSFQNNGIPALRPSGTTARRLLEFAIRAIRLKDSLLSSPDSIHIEAIIQNWSHISELHRMLGIRAERRNYHDDAAAFQVDYSMLWRMDSARSMYSLSYMDAVVLRRPVRRARERSWENRVSPITRILITQEEARLELHLAYAYFLLRERNWFELAQKCLEQASWLARILYTSVGPPKEYPLLQCEALLLDAEAQKALAEWQNDKTAKWQEPLEQAEALIERFDFRKRLVDARALRKNGTPWVGPSMTLIC